MKTSKPFSTISYNTADFLSVKLNDLVNRRKIAFWAYVEHLPEEDEKKAHKHLYIVPNGQINTDEVLLDILVDDRFMLDKKDLTLQFRGSSNQRIIDVPKSLAQNEVVIWDKLVR